MRTQSFEPPCDDGCDGNGCHEGLNFAVVAGGQTSPVFEATEHAFDDVSLAIYSLVVGELDAAMAHRRDDGGGAALGEPFAQSVSIVSLVGDQFSGRCKGSDTLLGDGNIRYISGGYDERPRSSAFVA